MRWLDKSPVDYSSGLYEIFQKLVYYVPKTVGWFGIASQTLSSSGQNSNLTATSTASSLFLSIAKSISDWVYTVSDLILSMYINPPPTIGNRWIEHIRNVYRDYGLTTELNNIVWEKLDNESITDYEARLITYANDLINLFRKQTVTKEDLEKSLKSILGTDSRIELIEPITQLKPWPGPEQYRSSQLSAESDISYFNRLNAYDLLYKARKKLSEGTFSRPNTRYPVPANTVVNVPEVGYQEDETLKNLRIEALKSNLGSYNYLGRTISRRYSSERHQGGRLEVIVSAASVPEDLINKINALKAAGVLVTLYVYTVLDIANTSASVSDLVIVDLDKTFIGAGSDGPRVPVFISIDQ